jgi:hypothetical protein
MGAPGPSERPGGHIGGVDMHDDGALEDRDGLKHAVSDDAFGQQREEALEPMDP